MLSIFDCKRVFRAHSWQKNNVALSAVMAGTRSIRRFTAQSINMAITWSVLCCGLGSEPWGSWTKYSPQFCHQKCEEKFSKNEQRKLVPTDRGRIPCHVTRFGTSCALIHRGFNKLSNSTVTSRRRETGVPTHTLLRSDCSVLPSGRQATPLATKGLTPWQMRGFWIRDIHPRSVPFRYPL